MSNHSFWPPHGFGPASPSKRFGDLVMVERVSKTRVEIQTAHDFGIVPKSKVSLTENESILLARYLIAVRALPLPEGGGSDE